MKKRLQPFFPESGFNQSRSGCSDASHRALAETHALYAQPALVLGFYSLFYWFKNALMQDGLQILRQPAPMSSSRSQGLDADLACRREPSKNNIDKGNEGPAL